MSEVSSVVESLDLKLHLRNSPRPASESSVGLGVVGHIVSLYDLGLVLASSIECTKGEALDVHVGPSIPGAAPKNFADL